MTKQMNANIKASKDDEDNDESSESVYDSGLDEEDSEIEYDSDAADTETSDEVGDEDSDEDDRFEDQGSSDEEEDILRKQVRDSKLEDDSSEDELEILEDFESVPRTWTKADSLKRNKAGESITDGENVNSSKSVDNSEFSSLMHTDDLSSDDEDFDGNMNRIGRVPLHWYDEYDHIGYNVHGTKVVKKSSSGNGMDLLDKALQNEADIENRKYVVFDALNDVDVELTPRQLELIRRVQAGAFAHPEHDANPDYIDYFSGVDKAIAGINSDRHEPKSRFQPSKYEKMQVRRLLHKLQRGDISMDYLTGDVKDMNDAKRKNKNEGEDDKPFLLWKGDEEDELHNRKGPQHIAAPKVPPPTHAESYNPPDEYLPTEDEMKSWEDMDVKDRPHGLLIPKKFPNLRSVGAYEHAVRERFERCLDLYLCPRVLKRRLNIDPESLVPSLPKAQDLKPFPTSKCIEYQTPHDDNSDPPMIRCLTVSPDGQFMASGASDGFVRLWEVQTGRLLRSWDLWKLVGEESIVVSNDNVSDDDDEEKVSQTKPIVSIEWNPNRSHHCLLAAVGKCIVVIATGTGGPNDTELTDALLYNASICKEGYENIKNPKAAKAVKWRTLLKKNSTSTELPISAFGGFCSPIVALHTNREVASVKWHKKGDYFVTVCPKAGPAAVLIHQLSKANSQQPFSKTKDGEIQCACFHPNKPFLFVASRQHVRVYHLVKQMMVKRLLSGCRWISTMDVHTSGDHLIVGSLDKRMVWFDLDLSNTPYKTLKYHERAIRAVSYHTRYPLMASSSDDGNIHVFHSMVYSDLMRNPLIVPVKILSGHSVVNKFGVLTFAFHPTQPWLFSGGADGKIYLFQDI
jgi:ribosome biogenesis protein ERB1